MRLRLAPAALLALSLLVAGCGDDGDDEATDRDNPTTTEDDGTTTSESPEGTGEPEPEETAPPPTGTAAPDFCDRVSSLDGLQATMETGPTPEGLREAAETMRNIGDAAPAIEADLQLVADLYEGMAESLPGADNPDLALMEAMGDLDEADVLNAGNRVSEYVEGECGGE